MRLHSIGISQSELKDAQRGLPISVNVSAVLKREMHFRDEGRMAVGQSRGTNANAAVAGCRVGVHPSRELTSLGSLRFGCSLPKCFTLTESRLYNAPSARWFCGRPALFLWRLCARFQINVRLRHRKRKPHLRNSN